MSNMYDYLLTKALVSYNMNLRTHLLSANSFLICSFFIIFFRFYIRMYLNKYTIKYKCSNLSLAYVFQNLLKICQN